jgi:RimJ/RimL family protein N-acetyltransferase
MPSPRLTVRAFTEADAHAVAQMLAASRAEYTRYFHPFAFDAATIATHVAKAVFDQWFLLEIAEGGKVTPAGFYMLRGLDEGFPDPMFGVFVAEAFAGQGLGRLTLAHAETQCRLNRWPRLRLKVDPANSRALRIYQAAGFIFERVDAKTGDRVLCRELAR